MKIVLPKIRGFCYGVSLIVTETERLLANGEKPILYGEPVHNPSVTEGLIDKGAQIIGDTYDVPPGTVRPIVIRAHGVGKKEYDEICSKAGNVVDMTCPKVKKIHYAVKKAVETGRNVIVIGNREHPEIKGIVGQCDGSVSVISTVGEAETSELPENPLVVSQTTFNSHLFGKISGVLVKRLNAEVLNTVCPATEMRQNEIDILSQNADIVIVIGGMKSSNSKKLCDIAEKHTKAIRIEREEEIDGVDLSGFERVLLCSGSSTPIEHIENTAKRIAEKYENSEIVRL